MSSAESFAASAREPLIASRYRVVKTLAEGATGTVLEVVDEATQQTLALKRLKAHSRSGNTGMFQREFYVLATMQCEQAPRVYDYDEDEDGPFFTMELLDARVLDDLPPLAWRESCRVLRDIALALDSLHARRLVHRDINTRNISISQTGSVKLLDFGAVAPFGAQTDVVGVPPFVCPESVHGQSMDGRSDLYALGALAFYLLSGRHAYPASSLLQLNELWQHPPSFECLGQLQPDGTKLPEHLVSLVRALLSPNPMARPANALTLIDQLQAIARLQDTAASAPLQTRHTSFIGRSTELAAIRGAFEKARRGRGSSIVIEAPNGVGKTRLLIESALELRIQGGAVLAHTSIKSDVPYSTASDLAVRLLDTLPDIARSAALPHAPVLAHVSPHVREKLGLAHPDLHELEPATRRVQLQAALHDWFVAVAHERPLVLVVDDLDMIDEPSAAWLTALAHDVSRRQLLIVSSGALDAKKQYFLFDLLRQHSRTLTLAPFTPDETLCLVVSMFQNTPNVPRLAAYLQRVSSGNPAHCLELCQHLVEADIVARFDGIWVIPQNISLLELPVNRQEILKQRLERLTDSERAFARDLSVQAGELPHEVCDEFRSNWPDVHSVLESLCEKGILERTSDGYRFAQEELRKTLHAELKEPRMRSAHRQMGRAWINRRDPTVIDQLAAGVHLLQGAELREGGRRLVQACSALQGSDGYSAAAPMLEQALKELRRQQRGERELILPLACLSIASYFTDRRLAERYGPETLAVMERNLGLHTIQRLRPFVGARAAVVLGLASAAVGFILRRNNPLIPRFPDALRLLFQAVSTLVSVHAICVDPREAIRCANTLEPLAAGLGPKHLGSLIYRECVAVALVVQDHQADPWQRFEGILETLRTCDNIPGLDGIRTDLLAGALYARGVQEVWRDDSQALLLADDLESLNGKLYAMYADKIRTLHYAHRGRLYLAQQYEQKVEEHAIQSGSAWQAETWSVAASISLLFRTDDAIGMKRAAKELQRISTEVPSLALLARRAYGAYLLLRGQPAEALAELEALTDEPMAVVGWTRSQATRARAYNALGRHEEAKRVCLEAMQHLDPADHAFTAMNLCIQIELAMAETGLGETERAAHMLGELFNRCAPNRNPLSLGALHEASARTALAAGHRERFVEHARAMRAWYLPTAVPTLIQRCERLDEEGACLLHARQNPDAAASAAHADPPLRPETCSTADQLLTLLTRGIENSETAFLFSCSQRASQPQLIARVGQENPTPSLRWWVRECLSHASEDQSQAAACESLGESSEELLFGTHQYRFFPLYDGPRLVGGAVLDTKEGATACCDSACLHAVGRQLTRFSANGSDQRRRSTARLPTPPQLQ